MKKTIQTEICNFSDLSPEQQTKCLDKYRDINVDRKWWDSSIDFYKTLLGCMGFQDVQIYFRGFSSQGDGTCFVADYYRYKKDAAKKIQEYSPTDTAFAHAAKEVQELQRRYFYGLTGKVEKRSSHYEHENTVSCELFNSGGYWAGQNIEEEFNTIIRSLMRHIYRQLEDEHDDLTSDEQVQETIEANNYFFNPSTLEIEA